jgi:ABC-type branched-subunit amino acid transport system substrate-binding protein
LLVLLGCSVPAPTERVSVAEHPAVAVVVPLSGQHAGIGQGAVQGVMLAVDDAYRVVPVDEASGDPVGAVKAVAPLVGVVAHITNITAARYAPKWEESGLPVVLATNQIGSKLPAILPDTVAQARCASAFLPPKTGVFLANDGSAAGINGSQQLTRLVDRRYLYDSQSVDPRQIGREAQRVKGTGAALLVYTGDAATGGNLLRTLRSVDSRIAFFGVGLYDAAFLTAAGTEASHGAIVTSADRPGLDPAIRQAYETRFGAAPSAPALDAYDAARLLRAAYEAAEAEGDQDKLGGTRVRLPKVETTGVAGVIHIGRDGTPDPDWCTGFAVKQGTFNYRGVARADDAGTVIEIVHEAGMAMPEIEPASALAPAQ